MLAEKNIKANVELLAAALVILLFSALMDRIPDDPGLCNSPSVNSPHLSHSLDDSVSLI